MAAAVVRSHKDLIVWRKAVSLTENVYRLTHHFPREEQFGLTSQMRRSAISIASNIAEGSSRRTRAEFMQFLYIARGSLSELETQLEISVRLGLAQLGQIDSDIEEVGRMLSALIKRLRLDAVPEHRRLR